MRRNKYSTALLAFLLIGGLAACDVSSARWGPVSSSYKGKVRVRADGAFANRDNRLAVNRSHYRDVQPRDGNTVYVNASIRWWKYSYYQGGGSNKWVAGSSKSTPETSSSAYVNKSVSWSLDDDGSRARAAISVCAQMGWPIPDSCSSGGVPTFDY